MDGALVFGNGKSGRAAEALLAELGFATTVLDGGDAFPAGSFSVAVVSPGVALTHPWIAEASRRGIPLKSELQLGCETLRSRGWKLLAVTGSKGKSSVVKLVAEALALAGRHAVACGNYGLPVAEVARSHRTGDDWAVVEVSSFMMETTRLPADTFEAAVILNLQEDHLDRHGTVGTYHALKRRLLDCTPRGGDFSSGLPRGAARDGELFAGSYFDNAILRSNAEAAVFLLRAAGLGEETIRRAFAAFVPLPHRMNLVAEIGGVRYVDDSKATSLAALAAGVAMTASDGSAADGAPCRTVRLIAGGLPKGDDPKSVCAILTARVKKVYLIGQCAGAFFDAWRGVVDCEVCGTLDRALERAAGEAVSGETVLLSPGTASFDQFESFGQRGEVFTRLVKEKEKKR